MDPNLNAAAFLRLAEALASGGVDAARNSLSLVFEPGISVTMALHPSRDVVGVDLWCADLASLPDDLRRLAVHFLLGLNAVPGGVFAAWLALDERDFVLLHGQAPLAGLETESFVDWLQDLIARARQVASFVDEISLSVPTADTSSGVIP
jgi:hypothetical protein